MVNLLAKMHFTLYCLLLGASLIANSLEPLLVTLPNGKIQGHELKTFTNKSYYAYESIPYAAPPVGNLRFQPPQPPQNWSGVLNATGDSKMCYQILTDHPRENEDCLYINVYTPLLNRESNKTKLPVLFWIYGGGLRNGAANRSFNRPEYWMDEDVILVTHNYRVGIFGFLSTGDSVIPGNYGLKDQCFALKWAYENIHLFGGDKDKITLHGISAGAVCSLYHMLIKQSAGMFRSVIAQSGTPMNMYQFIQNPKDYALELAQAINPKIYLNSSSEEIRDFFMSLDGKTIDSYSKAPINFQPAAALEPDSPTAVLTKEMYEMFDSSDFFPVPVLMGICSEEALYMAKSTNYLKQLGRTYDADPSLVVPTIFPHNENISETVIGKAVKLIYLNETDFWFEHPDMVVRQLSDQVFTRAIIKQGKMLSQQVPVYFYQFSYDGVLDGFTITVEGLEKLQHAGDEKYVFLDRDLSKIDPSDALTHKRIIRLWSNFIKYGNPTPEPDELLQNIIWPTVSPTDYKYLNINISLKVETDPRKGYFSKWEKVFETYGRRPFATY